MCYFIVIFLFFTFVNDFDNFYKLRKSYLQIYLYNVFTGMYHIIASIPHTFVFQKRINGVVFAGMTLNMPKVTCKKTIIIAHVRAFLN